MSTKEVKKRKTTHKYSEIDGEEIDETTVNKVLNKTKRQDRQRHAFDGVSADDALTETQVK